jgi:hypothetical protein
MVITVQQELDIVVEHEITININAVPYDINGKHYRTGFKMRSIPLNWYELTQAITLFIKSLIQLDTLCGNNKLALIHKNGPPINNNETKEG